MIIKYIECDNEGFEIIDTKNLTYTITEVYLKKPKNYIRSGNRSISFQLNDAWYKAKGVGVEKYNGHFGSKVDRYSEIVGYTNIQYMPYNLFLRRPIDINDVVITNVPYQDFIGEPIGACGIKELKTSCFRGLLDEEFCLSSNCFVSHEYTIKNQLLYYVFSKYTRYEDVDNLSKTLADHIIETEYPLWLNAYLHGLDVLLQFVEVGIRVARDKNILSDFSWSGRFKDLADCYLDGSKESAFGMLYNYFRMTLELLRNVQEGIVEDLMKQVMSHINCTEFNYEHLSDKVTVAAFIAYLLDLNVSEKRGQSKLLTVIDSMKEKNKFCLYDYNDSIVCIAYDALTEYYNHTLTVYEIVKGENSYG